VDRGFVASAAIQASAITGDWSLRGSHQRCGERWNSRTGWVLHHQGRRRSGV